MSDISAKADDLAMRGTDAVRMGHDLCICVVSYSKHSLDFPTMLALQAESMQLAAAHTMLLVWNNGPQPFSEDDVSKLIARFPASVHVVVQNHLENEPLSDVYNAVIRRVQADRYCFLDDDSRPDGNYLNAICSGTTADLIVPKIMSGGQQHGPRVAASLMQEGVIAIAPASGFFAIGSGLVLSRSLVDSLEREFGEAFDCAYAFYGVDTSLCIRLESLALKQSITVCCVGNINHDLSRLSAGAGRNTFRRTERGWDLGITLRRYPQWRFVKTAMAAIVRSLAGTGTISARAFVSGYLAGAHPRSTANKERKQRSKSDE